MNKICKIGNNLIGPGCPVYIIAEISANHNQDYDQAVKLIEAAKEIGADAVKLQTYTPDTLTIDCDNEYFKIGKGTLWEGKTLYNLYGEAYTPWPWQPKLKKMANDLGMDLFSTPFDNSSVDFLEEMDVPCYKIASFENVDLPLIRKVASTGKPLIISTGMATQKEINEAVITAHDAGCQELILLKCTSAYPADPESMNLNTIPHLIETFNIPIGLSDHSLTTTIPVAAVALGASVIEKHLTLSRQTLGPDSQFSLEPLEFQQMVNIVRMTEKALGKVEYGTTEKEKVSKVFRRSLFVVQDINAGEMFTSENVRSIRPGNGLHTRHIDEIIGQKAARNIKRGTPLTWDCLQK